MTTATTAFPFTLERLSHSDVALRLGIDNTPTDLDCANLARVSQQLARVCTALSRYAHSISIHSGYRCPQLNTLVGGSPTSAHMAGLAVDFTCHAFGTPYEICRAILAFNSNTNNRAFNLTPLMEFDQLICEGNWVHLGLAPSGQTPRGEVLTARFANAKATYTKGLMT